MRPNQPTHPLHRPAVVAVAVLLLAAPAAAETPLTLSAHVDESVLRLKFAVEQNVTTAFSQIVVLRRKSASAKFTRLTAVKESLTLTDADGFMVLRGGPNRLEIPARQTQGLGSGTLELALPEKIAPNDEFCIAVDVNGARHVVAGDSAFVMFRMIGIRPAAPAESDAPSKVSPAAEQRLAACRAALPPKPAQR